MSQLLTVPIDTVIQSKSQLREVDRTSQKFKDMVASLGLKSGLINPISVRTQFNKDTQQDETILVDGAHRLAACKVAGFTEIPVHVLDVNELEAMFAQMIGNAMKTETKPYEFAKQLRRALAIDPSLSVGDLASRTKLSDQWIRKLLKLDKLKKEIGASVDKGSIDVVSAIALATLPEEVQDEWAKKAITAETSAEFCEAVATYQRERKKAEREGRDPSTIGFVPTPKIIKWNELKALFEDESSAGLSKIVEGSKSPLEAGQRVLAHILQMDTASVESRKSSYEAHTARQKEQADKKKLESKKRLAEKKAKEAADLEASLNAGDGGGDEE